MAKKEKTVVKQWYVPMKLEFDVNAIVEATTEREAVEKAAKQEWVDNGINRGEMINWEVTGDATECPHR